MVFGSRLRPHRTKQDARNRRSLLGCFLAFALAVAATTSARSQPAEEGNAPVTEEGNAPVAEEGNAPVADGASAQRLEGVRTPATENGFRFLDQVIARGTITRLYLLTSESFAGSRVETPIVVIHGQQPGPKICIVAGIHGDEVNGVEVVRRAVASVSPASLRGTVIAVPIANLSAFRRGSRYLPDRRDLNRYFPGRLLGSSASRIAFGLFSQVIQHCEAVVDLHTGSFHRTNLHQLRADLSNPGTVQLAADFGAAFVVNSAGREGTLRRAATDEGIPAITVEAGQPTLFDEGQVLEALAGILRLLRARGMIETPEAPPTSESPTAFLGTRWVRADQGGVLVSRVGLGQQVQAGQMLGTISDPLSDEVEAVIAPVSGRLLGMALDQVVMPGFAAYHIGFDARPFDRMIVAPTTRQNVREVTETEGLDLEERPE